MDSHSVSEHALLAAGVRAPGDAIVVLGCRVRVDGSGRLSGGEALRARIDTAAIVYARRAGSPAIVVASGGRRWGGLVEADVMARELERRGVPGPAIVRERSSQTTKGNARFTAAVLGRLGIRHATVVTSDWHLPRAVALFRQAGLPAVGVAAPSGKSGTRGEWASRLFRRARERLALWLQVGSPG